MAVAGPAFPTAGTSAAESPWLDNDWTTPGNVTADDGTTASCTAASYDSPDQTFVLKATGFDFSSIPDGSTINGVTCRVNAWFASGQGSGSLDLCQLLNTSAAKVGTNQCATPVALTTTTSTVITKGSASDLWGNALTAAWVKDPDFGVALGVLATAANADVFIDYVTLEIDYTAPAPTGTLATTLAGATLAASGAETITGTAVSALAGATLDASGTAGGESVTGTLATTLAGATLASSGTETVTGIAASTLGGATLAATGAETISGTVATALAGASLAASGAETIAGTLSITLAGAGFTASGTETVTGALTSTLDGATLAASGSGGGSATGTLSTTLSGAALTASGTVADGGGGVVTPARCKGSIYGPTIRTLPGQIG